MGTAGNPRRLPWTADADLDEVRDEYSLRPIFDGRGDLVGFIAIGHEGADEGPAGGLDNLAYILALVNGATR